MFLDFIWRLLFMIRKIYSVYDSKTEIYFSPQYFVSRGEAIRVFTELCNDPNNQLHKYPADFTLFELGSFDDTACKFVINSTPISIGLAQDFVKSNSLGVVSNVA